MNGAQALIRTLVASGVDTCFANPGTSEMHFVAALDSVPEMRAVLALFEGVVTGAADGYGRMADRPAATLLHLGPGLGNGTANLHNTRRARTPLVNLVGDHATYHRHYDAPLTSDIEGLARNTSAWVRTSASTAALPATQRRRWRQPCRRRAGSRRSSSPPTCRGVMVRSPPRRSRRSRRDRSPTRPSRERRTRCAPVNRPRC